VANVRSLLLVLATAWLAFIGSFPGVASAAPHHASSARPESGTAEWPVPPEGPAFLAMSFPTAQSGWVVGAGFIWHTEDGGHAWTVQYRGPVQIEGIQAVSPATAYAWGPHTLLATADAGRVWHPVLHTKSTLWSFSWVGPRTGYAIMGPDYQMRTLHYTADGGRVFIPVRTPFAASEVAFATPSHGWVLGPHGQIDRTTDGGRNWVLSFKLPPIKGIPASNYEAAELVAAGPTTAWVLYQGTASMSQAPYSLYRTLNGVTWRAVLASRPGAVGPAPGNPQGVPSAPGSSPGGLLATGQMALVLGTCEACGMGSAALTTTTDGGRTWSPAVTIPDLPGVPFLSSDIAFPTRSRGYLAVPGMGATILTTNDGGQEWTPVWPSHAGPFRGVSFLSATVGFGLGLPGNAGAVLASHDGGRLWHQIAELPGSDSTPYADGLGNGIVFSNPADGVAIGPARKLYRTNDGGRHWQLANPTVLPADATIALVDGRGCVGSPYGTGRVLWTTHDVSWRLNRRDTLGHCLMNVLPSWMQEVLKQSGTTVPMTAGGVGNTVFWQTTSTTWTVATDRGRRLGHITLPDNASFGVNSMDYATPADAWVELPGGLLYHSTDGGLDWTRLP
jgi:photosystem II stability/assembly factor-like uncharacterized protein